MMEFQMQETLMVTSFNFQWKGSQGNGICAQEMYFEPVFEQAQ